MPCFLVVNQGNRFLLSSGIKNQASHSFSMDIIQYLLFAYNNECFNHYMVLNSQFFLQCSECNLYFQLLRQTYCYADAGYLNIQSMLMCVVASAGLQRIRAVKLSDMDITAPTFSEAR